MPDTHAVTNQVPPLERSLLSADLIVDR
jgi:hypothetical protein